jgi:hypothetical protein
MLGVGIVRVERCESRTGVLTCPAAPERQRILGQRELASLAGQVRTPILRHPYEAKMQVKRLSFRPVGPPNGLGSSVAEAAMEDTSIRDETNYPCRDLCLDPCLPYPSPDPRPDPCLEITELYVDQRVGRRGSGLGSRQRWGKTKIETRIGTRIEKPNTLENTPSFRPALPLLVLAAVLCSGSTIKAGPESDDWNTLKGKHFIVSYEDDARFAQDVMQHAERYYDSIVKQLGFKRLDNFWLWERRARIRIHADRAKFAERTGAPLWAAAKVNLRDRMIDVCGSNAALVRSRLPHEMAHLVFREYIGFEGEVPLWLDEGVAQWCELGARNATPPQFRKWIPLQDLMAMDVRKIDDPRVAHLFYGEAASLVHYLVTVHGREKFTKLCRQLRDGKTLEGALRFTYPRSVSSMATLEREWVAWQSAHGGRE